MAKIILFEEGSQKAFVLRNPVTKIGRAQDNQVVLKDGRASRYHCRIEKVPAGFQVVDSGSQNGTRLNGSIIGSEKRILRPGDSIRIGKADLFFEIVPDGEKRRPTKARKIVTEPNGREGENALAVERENFNKFQRINKAINSELDLKRLLEIIMDSVIELTSAERGFLILTPEGKMEFEIARNFEKESLSRPQYGISRTIADGVATKGEPILAINAVEDDRFKSLKSVADLGLRSVICVPLRVRDNLIGTLYIDNRLHKGVFCQEDLHRVEAFADQAAIAIENARLYRNLRTSLERIEKLNAQLSVRVEKQEKELAEVKERLKGRQDELVLKYDYGNIQGRSPKMREVLQLLDRIIEYEVPVLIQGESGTGKELVARAIHFNSSRCKEPFVSENCGALPDTLLESELFGYMRGAFTGAGRDKKGLFQLAHKGTLFLDEVGDMSIQMQKKLLRVLQEGEVRPVGGKETIKVDVRLVSASNKNLKRMVRENAFREDLYYRLQVLMIELPPLRERLEDIPVLAKFFVEKISRDLNVPVKEVDSEVINLFVSYDWPGNVRELENEVRRIIALSDQRITPDALSDHIRNVQGDREVLRQGKVTNLNYLVQIAESREILKALAEAGGNKTRASELLGISRFTLQRKMDKYRIEGGKD